MGILNNFNSSKEGRFILSIIWGFGLAAIFRKACKGRNCIVIRGPEPEEMHNKIYSFDNKCYKYRAVNTSCNKN